MNRRTAISYVLLGGILVLFPFFFWKWWYVPRGVKLSQLDSFKSLIGELAECIIPKTQTPGAKDAHVEQFIVDMVKKGIGPKEQQTFLTGLNDLVRYCRRKFNSSFEHCSIEERQKVLEISENEYHLLRTGILAKVRRVILGRSFFEMLKEFTVIGYCTSEVGATQGLAYDPIPVYYQSCVPLIKDQKVWATK